jgi:hypothetical protein
MTTAETAPRRPVRTPAYVAWKRDRGAWVVQGVGESVVFILENFGGFEVILPFGRRPEEGKPACPK